MQVWFSLILLLTRSLYRARFYEVHIPERQLVRGLYIYILIEFVINDKIVLLSYCCCLLYCTDLKFGTPDVIVGVVTMLRTEWPCNCRSIPNTCKSHFFKLSYAIIGLSRPLQLQEAEAPRCADSRHTKVVMLLALRTSLLYLPKDTPGPHLC